MAEEKREGGRSDDDGTGGRIEAVDRVQTVGECVNVEDVREDSGGIRIGEFAPRGGSDPIPWVLVHVFLRVH